MLSTTVVAVWVTRCAREHCATCFRYCNARLEAVAGRKQPLIREVDMPEPRQLSIFRNSQTITKSIEELSVYSHESAFLERQGVKVMWLDEKMLV